MVYSSVHLGEIADAQGVSRDTVTDTLTKGLADHLADEVAGTWRGMMIVVPAEYWNERFAQQTPRQMAQFLRHTAAHIRLAVPRSE